MSDRAELIGHIRHHPIVGGGGAGEHRDARAERGDDL
jgi:hypothetical protein